MKSEVRINRNIKSNKIVLIDENGSRHGEIYLRDALNMAKDLNLDVVEISTNDNLPVCRLMDFGKWKYEQEKKRKNNNSQRKQQLKEIKFRPTTGDNDLTYRAKQVDKFISDGDKVKLTVKFKGREQEHMFYTGKLLLERFLVLLKSNYNIEGTAKAENNSIGLTLSPSKSQ